MTLLKSICFVVFLSQIGLLSACSISSDQTMRPQDNLSQLELQNPNLSLPGILTGGQPTLSDLKLIETAGYRTVINLRPVGEFEGMNEDEEVTGLGMTYINLPVAGTQGLTRANAEILDRSLKENGNPVFVHCASGNRVGALFALRARFIQGKSVEDALEVGKSTGLTRLEPIVREILSNDNPS